MNDKTAIGFIGCGQMGASMAHAIHHAFPKCSIVVVESNSERQEWLSAHCSYLKQVSMVDVFSCCQVIFLAIKPQAVHDLANSTQELIQNHHCIISMLAGVSQRTLHGLFKPAKIVRIMPNTPAKLMKGVTGILFDSNSSTHEKEWVTRLCQSFGQVIALGSDDEMNVITAISGSGPAFFYRMVESMIRFGESFGLKPAVATQAAIHTIVGAGSMLLDDPHPADQVKRVASSKGTTQAGLDMMDLQNFDTIMLTVLNRTYERAVELSKEAPC